MKMLPHLRTVIAMLRLGREIMESKLDKRLVDTVDIPDFNATEKLPADIENNLSLFTSTLADNLHADRGMAVALLNGVDDYRGTEDKDRHYSEEDIAQVTEASEQTLQQGISLLDSAMKLKTQQLNGKAWRLPLMMRRLTRSLPTSAVNFRLSTTRASSLREVMRRAHLAINDDDRKQALLMLSEAQWTESDGAGLPGLHQRQENNRIVNTNINK